MSAFLPQKEDMFRDMTNAAKVLYGILLDRKCLSDSNGDAFNELYAECTDAEKKQFMQAFIERIDIFPERREDGNWIRNIKFQFPVPILRDGKEVVRVDGISLDKEQSDEHTVTLEKFPTLETVCLLVLRNPVTHINIDVDVEEMVQDKRGLATYEQIKDYVLER